MRTRVRGAAVIVVATAMTLLAGCAPSEPAAEAGPHAVLRVHAGDAAVTRDGRPAEASAGDALLPGDVVTTSGAAAMADVAWSDGAITRLGPDTVFTVGDPVGALASRGAQDGGRTWNRTSSGPYAIDVAGAGRTRDRGELFVVDCRDVPCRILATAGRGGDGSLTSLRRAGVETVVDSSRLATWTELLSDEWALASAQLDEEAGLGLVSALFSDAEPSRGVLEGTFDVTRTGRVAECDGASCDRLHILQPGAERALTFVFHVDCAAGGGCDASVDTQTIDTADGALIDATTPLVAGEESYSWGTDQELPICIWTYADGTTEEVGRSRNAVRWTVTPTAAEVREGRFVVTELRGTTQSSLEIAEDVGSGYPGCEQFAVEWSSASDMVLTKRGG